MATNYNTKYANLQKLAVGMEDITGFINALPAPAANWINTYIVPHLTPENIGKFRDKIMQVIPGAAAAFRLGAEYNMQRSPSAGVPSRGSGVGPTTYLNVIQNPKSQIFGPEIQNTEQFVNSIRPPESPAYQQRLLSMNRPQSRSGPVTPVVPKTTPTTPATPTAPVV